MLKYEWLTDVLRPTETALWEDTARTAALGYNHDGIDAWVLRNPLVAQDGDVLQITSPRSLVDRLLRRRWAGPVELVLVHMAGATFTFVLRGWGDTTAPEWRKGAHVAVIGVVSRR